MGSTSCAGGDRTGSSRPLKTSREVCSLPSKEALYFFGGAGVAEGSMGRDEPRDGLFGAFLKAGPAGSAVWTELWNRIAVGSLQAAHRAHLDTNAATVATIRIDTKSSREPHLVWSQ